MATESETKAQAHAENMKRIDQKLARISGVEIPEEKPKEVKDATKKRQRTKSNQQQHKNPKKEGKPQKQAVAIALQTAKSMKMGGPVERVKKTVRGGGAATKGLNFYDIPL